MGTGVATLPAGIVHLSDATPLAAASGNSRQWKPRASSTPDELIVWVTVDDLAAALRRASVLADTIRPPATRQIDAANAAVKHRDATGASRSRWTGTRCCRRRRWRVRRR